MDAKTFEFRAKEQVTATYGFNKDQPDRESVFKGTYTVSRKQAHEKN